ncbi:hypothetical protein MMC26_002923 [Xylographa opegraphella]|nr:hypothetical protein [Xylographa opegraphella]
MAYTDDQVRAKLSALNETQESIVTVAQWIMFHRRHADRTGHLWLQRLKDSGAGKRLNLIYLANEVAQQSKARKKDDFLIAFSPIIAEATATAYKGATNEVQAKLRRVVEVWRQRQIFEPTIQEAVEARISDLDKSRSSGRKPLLGGSLFSSSNGPSAPAELQHLVPMQIAISKAAVAISASVSNANTEYDKLMDPQTPAPTPPVHAARLSALLKSLANAEGAVSESIKARQDLIGGLEKLLETNRTALASEQTQYQELVTRKTAVEAKKRDVEDGIMRGLSADTSGSIIQGNPPSEAQPNGQHEPPAEPERPQIEALTPPPVESLTPIGSPRLGEEATITSATGADIYQEQQANTASTIPPPFVPAGIPAGFDLLSSLSMPPHHAYAASPTNGSAYKKRKVEADFDDFIGGDAMADLDEDVAELLRAESGGR